MSALTPYSSSREAIATALASAGYQMPHARLDQLPEPFFLIPGDAKLPRLPMTTGTLVVTGSLEVSGPIDFQQTGKPIVNLVVVKHCTLGLAYVDAFLVVGGDLHVGTLIADSNWKGGVFVGGNLTAHTLVINNIGVEVDGDQHVEHLADTSDLDTAAQAVPALFHDESPEPRELFAALRDSSAPLRPAPKARKVSAARKPKARAAKRPKPPTAKQAKRKKPAAKKSKVTPAKKPARRAGRSSRR